MVKLMVDLDFKIQRVTLWLSLHNPPWGGTPKIPDQIMKFDGRKYTFRKFHGLMVCLEQRDIEKNLRLKKEK